MNTTEVFEAVLDKKAREMATSGRIPRFDEAVTPEIDRERIYYLEVTANPAVVQLDPSFQESVRQAEAVAGKLDRLTRESKGLRGKNATSAKKAIAEMQSELDEVRSRNADLTQAYDRAVQDAKWSPAERYKIWLGHSYGHDANLAEQAIAFLKKRDSVAAQGEVVLRIRSEKVVKPKPPEQKPKAKKKRATRKKA